MIQGGGWACHQPAWHYVLHAHMACQCRNSDGGAQYASTMAVAIDGHTAVWWFGDHQRPPECFECSPPVDRPARSGCHRQSAGVPTNRGAGQAPSQLPPTAVDAVLHAMQITIGNHLVNSAHKYSPWLSCHDAILLQSCVRPWPCVRMHRHCTCAAPPYQQRVMTLSTPHCYLMDRCSTHKSAPYNTLLGQTHGLEICEPPG